MIYLIFTPDGFEQAKADILQDQADVWINDKVLTDPQQDQLTAASINFNILPDIANPKNEKSVLAALDYVEKNADKTEILVEYL
ncbi:hypothetical protein A9Q78_04495 [Methylophaga sp. 41_12_T18]|nr:hypothetical protein A9Q78_04495 [Methylophaga sp. 41_12_T18]